MTNRNIEDLLPKRHLKNRTFNVGIGEILVKKTPSILKTSLGSCVAVIIHDAENKIGGMIHIILSSSIGRNKSIPGRYADIGIPHLLNIFEKRGGNRNNIKAYVVGGNNLISSKELEKSIFAQVGLSNLNSVKEILTNEKISFNEMSVRQTTGTVAVLDTETGQVTVNLLSKACCD
jgi:chemotaxis protein CheD